MIRLIESNNLSYVKNKSLSMKAFYNDSLYYLYVQV